MILDILISYVGKGERGETKSLQFNVDSDWVKRRGATTNTPDTEAQPELVQQRSF